jgi:GTP cyclohydrolase I
MLDPNINFPRAQKPRGMNKDLIAEGISLVLKGLNVDLTDHNFTDTPKRYAKAMEELFAQHPGEPTSFEETYTDFILVRGHNMYTLCPHHLLPVRMLVSLAYSGPVMQERFTGEVVNRMERALESGIMVAGRMVTDGYQPGQKGIYCHVEGWHGCMAMRGVQSNASTITEMSTGQFKKDAALVAKVMSNINRGR